MAADNLVTQWPKASTDVVLWNVGTSDAGVTQATIYSYQFILMLKNILVNPDSVIGTLDLKSIQSNMDMIWKIKAAKYIPVSKRTSFRGFIVVSDHSLEYWSLNPLYTWRIHLLDESAERIRFLTESTKFRYSKAPEEQNQSVQWWLGCSFKWNGYWRRCFML